MVMFVFVVRFLAPNHPLGAARTARLQLPDQDGHRRRLAHAMVDDLRSRQDPGGDAVQPIPVSALYLTGKLAVYM